MSDFRIPRPAPALAALFAAAAASTGCDEIAPTDANIPAQAHAAMALAPPAPLVTATAGGMTRTLWPFTGTDLGADAHASDPINLIFIGDADPRSIRATLLSLDGQRPGFPPLPFFQCVWEDAMGGNQTAWTDPDGWSGSAIQLECGSYVGLRMHLRLFQAGSWTLGNAHFETIIPGTQEHQVLNWELAEQFVTADLARAGVLAAPPSQTEPINPHPFFRTILPQLYWNPQLLPLHPVINAVVIDPQTIGMRTDGRATILTLSGAPGAEPGLTRQELVIAFDQVIPKPFCAGPTDYVHVRGPLTLRQDVKVSASGVLTRNFHASGELTATPVNPMTGQPVGPPSQARINGLYTGMVSSGLHATSSLLSQILMRDGESPQRQMVDWQVGPHGATRYRQQEECGR
ncbi:MAG TPA: hypothetical protein VK929_03750 [Longimicrobiales bacterium]|nr:hypothetical protein [Longimicrobiales bacterium]